MPATSPSASSLLAVDQRGDGVPVLLLHGIYGTGALFATLGAALERDYRVLAPDLRGHGDSGAITGSMGAEAVASDLLPLLDALDLDAVHVVGHSHGGATALTFARLAPRRVRSLTLVSAYAYQPLTWWERVAGIVSPSTVRLLQTGGLAALVRLGRSSGRGRRMTDAVATEYARQMSRNDAARMAAAFAAARSFDSRPWLAELRVPTLVIVGEADRMVSSGQSRLLVDGITRARLRRVPGAGHMLPLSHPEEFAGIVSGWLAEVDGRTAIDVEQGIPLSDVDPTASCPGTDRRRRVVETVPVG